MTPVNLRCEYLTNPLGVDAVRPRFSWTFETSTRGARQLGYRILVASTAENLAANIGDKWDSGKVELDRSANIAYQGEGLGSGEACYWQVRAWDRDDAPGPWSQIAIFEMGLLHDRDWEGVWIGAERDISSPLLRQEFTLDRTIKRARVYACGLGYCELYINGTKLGRNVLDPGTSYYHNDQPFEVGARALYTTCDVTGLLRRGSNAVGAMLGNGWYSAEKDIPSSPDHREPYGDRPKLILQMNVEFIDGASRSIVSDGTWEASGGPITYNDYCHGEDYDARLEKAGWNTPGNPDGDWNDASVVTAPNGVLTSQMLPPIQVMETIEPVAVKHLGRDVYVCDFGRNIAGWTRLRVRGTAGTRVKLTHATAVDEEGALDTRSSAWISPAETQLHCARQTDTYTLNGEGLEKWEPRFTLHGFRYVEVTGFPGTLTGEDVEARFVRSAVETTGRFNCSNPLLNQIHQSVCRSFLACLQSMPQSCVDRSERTAWLGDPGFIAEDYIYNFDMAAFWTKWLNDIKDSQKKDGSLPCVCPVHWRRTYDSYGRLRPAWDSTYALLVWYTYWYYGDERILDEHYEGVKKSVDFLSTKAENRVIAEGLGDHMEPQPDGSSSDRPRHTPVPLTSTAYYYFDSWILARAAEILGKREDASCYAKLAQEIKDAFNREFLDETTNQYGSGSQTSNALALHLGLIPPEREQAVVHNLVDEICVHRAGHLSTGIIGTNALEQALPKCGRADVMYQICTRTTFPSWGYMMEMGATSIWETWEGDPNLSLNCAMFGSTEKFFYNDLAGIGAAAPAFRLIVVKPQIVGDLDRAQAEVRTVSGKVVVHWKKGNKNLEMKVTIPANTKAEINVPKLGLKEVTIVESGHILWEAEAFADGVLGIYAARDTGDEVVFDAGSGSYVFQLTGR